MLNPKTIHTASTLFELFPDEIINRFARIKSRYLLIGNSLGYYGEVFVRQIFPSVEIFYFSENDLRPITRSGEKFDFFIIGGKDASRICRFIRSNADALQSSAKICVTIGSSPQRRARLLMAGFDDVFDIAKVDSVEAVARVLSIERRYLFADRQRRRNSRLSNEIQRIFDSTKPTKRERAIIELLLLEKNNEASLGKIKNVISECTDEISKNNIKVIISNLRKKISKEYRISFKEPNSYHLGTAQPD